MSSLVAVLGISALCCDVCRLYTHRKLKMQQATGWAMFTAAVCGFFASVTWATFINQNKSYGSDYTPSPTTVPTAFNQNQKRDDGMLWSEAVVSESPFGLDDTASGVGLRASFSLAYCIFGWFVQG
jgi:uncharacterized membrane protein